MKIQMGQSPAKGPMYVKPGTDMWFVDRTPILVCGMLNTMLTDEFGASFASSLPGDRFIHDYIRTGGYERPTVATMAEQLRLPRFSTAVWNDIVAIRRDSETLSNLREIMRDAANVDEEKALHSIKERLEEYQNRIKEDASIWKVVQGGAVDFSVGAIGGFLATLIGGVDVPLSIASGASAAGISYLMQLYRGTRSKDHTEARRRVDILTRIVDRM